jgi:quercetin dioxygenase-like cupin family protein
MKLLQIGCGAVSLMAMLMLLSPAKSLAQDPLKVAPGMYKLLMENESVRVMEVTIKPGDKIGMHSHPDHILYVLKPGTVTITTSDGKASEVIAKEGEVMWMPAVSHSAMNNGKTEFKGLVVEIK